MSVKSEMNIAELGAAADVSPRTVRYYVGVGLLPGPANAGRGAKYGEEHLRRLRTIARLKEERLTLTEIRSALEGGYEVEWEVVELEPGALELRVHREASQGVRARFEALLAEDQKRVARGDWA